MANAKLFVELMKKLAAEGNATVPNAPKGATGPGKSMLGDNLGIRGSALDEPDIKPMDYGKSADYREGKQLEYENEITSPETFGGKGFENSNPDIISYDDLIGTPKGSKLTETDNGVTKVEDGIPKGVGSTMDYEGDQFTKAVEEIQQKLTDPSINDKRGYAEGLAKEHTTANNVNSYIQDVMNRFKNLFDTSQLHRVRDQGTFLSKLRDDNKMLSTWAREARDESVPIERRRLALKRIREFDDKLHGTDSTKFNSGSHSVSRDDVIKPENDDIFAPTPQDSIEFSRTPEELSKSRAQQQDIGTSKLLQELRKGVDTTEPRSYNTRNGYVNSVEDAKNNPPINSSMIEMLTELLNQGKYNGR